LAIALATLARTLVVATPMLIGRPTCSRSDVVDDREDRSAGREVGLPARGDDDRLRAQPPRPSAAHGRPHAAGAGFVACGHHDAGSDDDRSGSQPRVIALLDRGEERVEVGVQDRGLPMHEHMFA